ncbi:MAG: cupredoxin domain-containing protein [Sphaerochaetaceae bacterium]
MWKKIIIYCFISFIFGFAIATWIFPPTKIDQPTNQQPLVETSPIINIDGATIVAPGTSPIKDGVVINDLSQSADNSAPEYSAEAPKLSKNIPQEQLPQDGIQINISRDGFSPNEFKVKAGEPVIIKISAVDQWAHILVFEDKDLQGLTMGLYGGENRVMAFNAPNETGEYFFRNDIFGSQGKMIVE